MDKYQLNEALQLDYRLRSTFFYRKLHEFGFSEFESEIDKLTKIADNFNWDSNQEWGVSVTAWNIINNAKISPLVVFAHPRLLQEQPRLSAYYRNVAALPQKAVSKLVFGVGNIELGKSLLSADRALSICKLYNSYSSLIIEGAANYTIEDARGLMFASAGAQINGSWLNRIGEEAEVVTRKILIRAALQAGYLVSGIWKSKTTFINLEDIVDQAAFLSGIRLNNQTSILFGSEPDLSLLNSAGELVGAIEVKGGKDTAGALERYGAAKKSFEDVRRQNSKAITILLVSCLTDEVQKRLETDSSVSRTFNLTDIVADEKQRLVFVQAIFKLLSLEFEPERKSPLTESNQ